MTTDKVNLVSRLAQFQDHWKPKTVAQLNEYDIMVVKVQGEFVWHKHDNTASLLLIEPTGTPNTGDARTAAPRQEL
jgi:hypothetical protein